VVELPLAAVLLIEDLNVLAVVYLHEGDSDSRFAILPGQCEWLGEAEELFIELTRLRQILNVDRHVGDAQNFGAACRRLSGQRQGDGDDC